MKLLAVGTGWTLSGNALSMTHDNGKHWTYITPSALRPGNQATRPSIADVSFVDSEVGHLLAMSPPVDDDDEEPGADHVGHYDLLSTTDGGATWTSHALPRIDDSLRLTGTAHISFINDREGVISMDLCGDTALARDTEVYITSNGGAKWRKIETPLNENIYGILYTNSKVLWVVGTPSPFDSVSESTRIFSRDAGATFHTVSLPAPTEIGEDSMSTYSLPSFADSRKGYELVQYEGVTSGGGNISVEYTTLDGGLSWKAGATLANLPHDLWEPFTVVDGHWIELYDTTDGAIKQMRPEPGTMLRYPSAKQGLRDRCVSSFVNLQTGWALCAGRLASTTDGGERWSFVFGG